MEKSLRTELPLSAFMAYIESQGCELYDDTDWGLPIYRKKGYGKMATVPQEDPISIPTMRSVCSYLDIPMPLGVEGSPDFVEMLRSHKADPVDGGESSAQG